MLTWRTSTSTAFIRTAVRCRVDIISPYRRSWRFARLSWNRPITLKEARGSVISDDGTQCDSRENIDERCRAIRPRRIAMRLAFLCLLASALLSSLAQGQVPVFVITPEGSTVQFSVKASVAIEGTFDKWEATMTFPSTDVTTGVLDIKIQAASVNTGSGMKDDKLRSKDFFNASEDPYITFHSTKIVQTGP